MLNEWAATSHAHHAFRWASLAILQILYTYIYGILIFEVWGGVRIWTVHVRRYSVCVEVVLHVFGID